MDGGSVLKGKESSGGAKWSGSQETWKEPEEKAASNSANPLSMCLSALLNQDRRASTRMALAISRYLLAPHKGKRGSSVPYSNGRRQVKTAWGREQSPQPAVAEMVCIQRAGPQSSSVLWAVTLSYYRAVSFPFCHVFCVCVCFPSTPQGCLFQISHLHCRWWKSRSLHVLCRSLGPPPPSKGFNNNSLFSVQQEGLQPCGIFPHSLKSSPLSGEESVSDVNVVLRVCKAFWSCLLSPQQDDKLRV